MNHPSPDEGLGRGRKDREKFYERLSVFTLYLAGFYFLIVPLLLPDVLGWTVLQASFGESSILCFAIGFLFLYTAAITRDKYRLRAITAETLEALNMFMFGPNYRRHREAVDLLIKGLGSDNESARRTAVSSLEKMTGESFGEDQDAWAAWWAKNRTRFSLRTNEDSAGRAPEYRGPATPKGEGQS